MKKQTLLSILFLLFFFTLGLNKAQAHPGDSCSNPISITPILTPTVADYLFASGDSVKWFAFTAPYSRLTIEIDIPINVADTPRAYVDSLIIYTGGICGSLVQMAYGTCASGSDSLPSIQLLNFTAGAHYYAKVTRYNKGVRGCSLCPAYMGLAPILLPAPVIPPSPCPPCGPNLFCNGNFEDLTIPGGYQSAYTGTCYQDDSYTWPATPPDPPLGHSNPYCIKSPNMRYGTGCSLLPSFTDYTDIYTITDGPDLGASYNNTPYSGHEFMFVDAPSNICASCSPFPMLGPIPTPLYVSTAWEEQVGIIPGATYLFTCGLRDADPASYGFPAASVSITINGPSYFSDVINNINYNNWTPISFCWSDPINSSATIQINGTGSANGNGYDYEIDSLTNQLSSLPIITYPNYTICSGSSVQFFSTYIGSSLLDYSWSPAASLINPTSANPIASPTVTTTYTCTISAPSQGTCTEQVMVTVTVSHPSISIIANSGCYSANNGTATASVSNGVSPYVYLWTPTGQTTATATGLAPGTYTLDVTDFIGCTASAIVVITTPPQLTALAYLGSASRINCYGGTISAFSSVSGGTPAYTYLWSPTGGTNASATLGAGTYTLTVTDANGCTATSSITITQPPQLITTASVTANVTCYGGSNGSALANASGGTSAYTYSWAPLGGTNASATGLTAGVYTITVTDNNGCTSTATVTITQPTAITIGFNPPNPKVCSSSGTSVTAIASGGTPSYTYHWSTTPAQTSALATGLTIGTYTVIITDSHGCTNSASVSVGSDNLGVTVANAYRCASGTGTLTANVSPGVGPYTYLWTPTSQTTISASGLSTGTYTVLVTDANGCTASASGTISVDGIGVSISDGTGTPTNPCVGYPITLTANVTPGIPAYTYAWSNGATTSSINFNVLAGSHNYTVIVTDANGCTASTFINITSDNLSVTLSGNTVACPVSGGGSNTLITSHATGGSSPYTYNWSPSGGTSSTANLSAGSYTLTVTDLNGCTATASIIITRDNIAVTSTNAMVCTTTGLASLTATATGTYSPFSYVWAPGGQTTATITGLAVGNYTVTATDANGCTASAIGSVAYDNLNASITAVGNSNLSCNTTPEFCPNASGGSSPYNYVWSITGGSSSAGPPPCIDVSWTNIYATNTLTLTVTDANGCSTSATYSTIACCPASSDVDYTLDNVTLINASSISPLVGTPSVTWTGGTPGTWTFYNFSATATLAIYGTLDIQTNMVINCSEVLMGTGAKIIVEPNCTLTIDESHLYACNQMWDNIDVKPGGTVITFNSLIEEAQQAIYAENGSAQSTFHLSHTVFNRDSIGVEVMPYASADNSYIGSCIFACNQPTGTICTTIYYGVDTSIHLLQIAPNASNRTAFGVIVRGVKSLTIGDPSNTLLANTFVDIDCGVYTEASSTTVVNSTFTNMTPTTGNNANVPLAGVWAKGGTAAPPYALFVGGTSTGANQACYFSRCEYGIWARDTINVKIQGNYMEGYPTGYISPPTCYGVYLYGNNPHCKLNVTYNQTIDDYEYGVDIYNAGDGSVLVDTNYSITSNTNWSPNYGVKITELSNNEAIYWVLQNTISAVAKNTGVTYGISCLDLDSAKIIYNDITLTGTGTTMNGIETDNCNKSTIKENTVNYSGSVATTIGIVLNGGTTTQTINCNTLDAPYTGLSINSNQSPIGIEQNNFDLPLSCPTAYGISLLSPSGRIGTNVSPAPAQETNTWNLFYPCGGLWATYNFAGLPSNKFIIPSSIITPSANDPTFTMNGGPNPILFSATGGSDTYSCSAAYFSIVRPLNTHDALFAINDSLKYTAYPQTSYWQDKYNLYDYMSADSSLADSSQAIRHFFDSTKNANIGRIVAINQLFSDTNGVSINDVTTATSLNNAITNVDTAESIYKKVYGIMLTIYNTGGQFIPNTPAQIATLDSMAIFCPGQYGSGVYVARALLSQIDTAVWPNTCAPGQETGAGNKDEHGSQKHKTNDSIANGITAKVYPNPANTVLNVETNLQSGQIAYFTMYNAIGEKIEDMQLTNDITTLFINNLPSGMYYYRITDRNGNPIKADKQMILH